MAELDDIKIQVETVTKYCLSELKRKFPGMEFDLMVRDFSSAIYLKIRKMQLSEVVKRTFKEHVIETVNTSPKAILLEEFGLAPSTFHFHENRGEDDYEHNIAFLKELRNIPVLREIEEVAGYNHLIPWINSQDNHDSFFKGLNKKYPSLFRHFGYEKTVEELKDVLKAAIERKSRSVAINDYIKDRSGIEDKLLGVYDWQKNCSEAWFEKIKKDYIGKFYIPGFQRITMTEIVPVGLPDYSGPVGGKTIKFGCFNDFNNELIMSQHDRLCNGFDKNKLDLEVFTGLRDLFLPMLVSRRYIFPEAIDSIIDFQEKKTGREYGPTKNAFDFRSLAFDLFFGYSKSLYDKIYLAYNLASDK